MKISLLIVICIILCPLMLLNAGQQAKENNDINIRLDNDKTSNNSPVFTGADEGEYMKLVESDENILILKGKIKMKFSDKIIYAQNVLYNRNTGDVTLTGDILLDDGKNRISAEKCIFNIKDNTGVLYNAKSTDKPVIFNTNKIRIVNRNTYVTDKTEFSTCELERPHYHFLVKKLIIYKDKRAIAFNAFYVVGDIPLFYFPIFPQSEDGTGITTQFGQSGRRGNFMQNTMKMTTESGDKWKYKLDIYEKLGYYGGVEYSSKDKNHDSFISLAGSKYKSTEPSESIDENNNWFKAVLNNDFLFNRRADSNSYSKIRFEWMNDWEFERYYEARREPQSTFMMFSFFPPDISEKPFLDWNYTIGDRGPKHEISLKLARQWYWWDRPLASNKIDNYSIKGKYVPYVDQLPVFTMKYNDSFYCFNDTGGKSRNDKGLKINWALYLEGSSYEQYENGESFSTTYSPNGYILLNTDFPFLNYFIYTPGIKNGFNAQWVEGPFNDDASSKESAETAAAKNTYEYFEVSNALKFGVAKYYLLITHYYRRSYLEKEVIEPFIHERRNNFEGGIYLLPSDDIKMSITTGYDTRRNFPFEDERLKDITVSNSIFLDFCRFFHDSKSSSNRKSGLFYSGIEATNNYLYITKEKVSGYNTFGIKYTTGNFSLPGIKRITNFELGYDFFHDYRFPFRDIMSFKWGIFSEIFALWRLEIGGFSQADRAHLLYNGNKSENIFDDLKKSLYFYDRDRSDNAVFTLRNFFVNIIHDLHCWEIGFFYNLQRRTDNWGPERKDKLMYYEHLFFISLTLKTFTGEGFQKTRVFPLEQRQEKQY